MRHGRTTPRWINKSLNGTESPVGNIEITRTRAHVSSRCVKTSARSADRRDSGVIDGRRLLRSSIDESVGNISHAAEFACHSRRIASKKTRHAITRGHKRRNEEEEEEDERKGRGIYVERKQHQLVIIYRRRDALSRRKIRLAYL